MTGVKLSAIVLVLLIAGCARTADVRLTREDLVRYCVRDGKDSKMPSKEVWEECRTAQQYIDMGVRQNHRGHPDFD